MSDRTDDYHQGIREWVDNQAGPTASTVDKGNAFCQWVLENVFELTSDDALDAQSISGSRDHSIDALILGEDSVQIVQTKFDTSHDYSEMTKFHYDMCRIRDGKTVNNVVANDDAQRAIADIRDAYSMDWEVKFYYVTSEYFTLAERSKIHESDGYGSSFFFYDLEDIAKRLDSRQEDIPNSIKGKWFDLPLSNREILKFANTTAVIAVSLTDMHQFVQQCGDDLFTSNVRQYLRNTKVNRGIVNTIQETPEDFWLYNNGITVVCDDFAEETFTFRLQTPQIVNGCQTARSIWQVLSKKTKDARDEVKGHVLVRIIKDPDESTRDLITKHTNTQNAVRGKDFFSLESFHKRLQNNFRSIGYYYEIQRGAFTALKPSEKAKYVGVPAFSYLIDSRFKNIIPASESAQSFAAAFRNLPAIAYGGSEKLTPTGSSYEDVFDESLRPEPKLFLYPYLVRIWAQSNGYGRGAKGGWRAYSVLFFVHIYFTVVLEILKNSDIVDTLESSPEVVPLGIWDRIFESQDVNQKLLLLADDILERYFDDSKVDEAVGQDVRKFLRSQEMLDRHKDILRRVIENRLDSPHNARLIEETSETVRE